MNEFADRDSDNLDFILSLDKVGLALWFAQATEDDVAYAVELMAQHSEELVLEQVLKVTDWTEANAVISAAKFRSRFL